MKFGIPISFTLHAAFLGGGIFLFNETPYIPEDNLIVPVDIIDISKETNVKAAVKRREPEAEREIDIPAAETPLDNADVKDEASKQAETLPEPVKDVPVETAAEPSVDISPETKTPDELPEDTPENLVEAPETPSFSLDDLSALIDRSRDSQPEANQQKVLQSEETLYAFADAARRGAGAGDGLALSQIDALRAAMYKCWRIPADAKDPESLIIPVEVKLHRDGHIASVNLKNAGAIYGSPNPYMKVAADNALRAVSKCAPYDFLPVEDYDSWKHMTLTFRPILSQ